MLRANTLEAVDGYREDLIAGEEPELCVRLRTKGWRIWRLDAEMTLHDAAMTCFSQWWRRAVRAGYSYGQGAHLHGSPPSDIMSGNHAAPGFGDCCCRSSVWRQGSHCGRGDGSRC